MSKYIEAEVFKAKIMNYGRIYEGDRIPIPFYKEHCGKMFTELLRWVCEEVDDALPADVVEVVRCKDCKHSEEFIYPEGLETMVCWEDSADREVNRNGFCEKGERKDE